MPLKALPVRCRAPHNSLHSQTFDYTGAKQAFKVPAGVNSIAVVARGAAGAGQAVGKIKYYGGRGGRVSALLPVRPGEVLYVFVGGAGSSTSGGFNGGGSPGSDNFGQDYGGGGASDVREH